MSIRAPASDGEGRWHAIGEQASGSAGGGAEERRLSHKRADDPRLTPLGRTLRRWSLDELPQLWNVVRHEMSLLGRAHSFPVSSATLRRGSTCLIRSSQGLTGTRQIYARGDGQVKHERTNLDIAHVHTIELLSDLKILLLTIPAVIGLKKGY